MKEISRRLSGPCPASSDSCTQKVFSLNKERSACFQLRQSCRWGGLLWQSYHKRRPSFWATDTSLQPFGFEKEPCCQCPSLAHHSGCQGRAMPLPGGRNMKQREIQSFDKAKCKHSKNTSATVYLDCTLALLCHVTATTFVLQLHLTRTQLSSLGPSQLFLWCCWCFSPLSHPSHPTTGLSITPQQLSGYREPGVPSAHPCQCKATAELRKTLCHPHTAQLCRDTL